MGDSISWRAVRYVLAAYYLFAGCMFLAVLVGVTGAPPEDLPARAAAFQRALTDTGFVNPLLAVTFIVSSCFLVFYRTAPLGVALLAPPILMILLTNVFLAPSNWWWGVLHAAIEAALLWHFRDAFSPLWNRRNRVN